MRKAGNEGSREVGNRGREKLEMEEEQRLERKKAKHWEVRKRKAGTKGKAVDRRSIKAGNGRRETLRMKKWESWE
jgi:hypothetical protein